MAKTIGIDLGTTNSCVAIMESGQSKVIVTAQVRHGKKGVDAEIVA